MSHLTPGWRRDFDAPPTTVYSEPGLGHRRGRAGTTRTSCVFCDIVDGRAAAHRVYEDEKIVAFLDLFPITRGHVLVVPKRHVDRLTELPPEEYPAFVGALAEVCRRIERLTTHYNVALNQGSLAGQIVYHLHFHVIPRYDNGNPFLAAHRARLSEGDAREIVARLSAA